MIAFTVLGVAILTALVLDILLTLFPPLGTHGGPVHRRQNRLIWSLFRTIGIRRDGSARPGVLAMAGPVGAMLTLVLWGGWLVIGFALVYLPAIPSFAQTGAPISPDWVEALYYSGYVASTLGLGDVVATTTALRLITIVEALAGFGLFAVATAYVMAISREHAASSTLAIEVSSLRHAGLADSEDAEAVATLARWAERWARTLLQITHAHGQYPLLHFFRPADPDRALLVQLEWLMALAGLETPDTPERPSPLPPHSASILRHALERYLRELNHGCIPHRFRPLPPGEPSMAELYARLLWHMGYESGSATER
jgi:Ion channel